MSSNSPRITRLAVGFSASAVFVAACAGLAGCGSVGGATQRVAGATQRVAGAVKPYRAPVVQGNFVSREQAAYLRPGISREQVRDILGTPLVTSVFHGDRWDYAFTMERQGSAPQAYRLAVFFKDDRLERVEGDTLPTEAEFADAVDARPARKAVPVLEATEAQLQRFGAPRRDAASAPTAPPASVSAPGPYPPLEPTPAR